VLPHVKSLLRPQSTVTIPSHEPLGVQPVAFAHCVGFSLPQEVEIPLHHGSCPPDDELLPPPELLLEEPPEPPPEDEPPPLELPLADAPLLPELRPDDDPPLLLELLADPLPLLEPPPLVDEGPPLLVLLPEDDPDPPPLEPAPASDGATQRLLTQLSPALQVPFP
jgi:hypothetical protein